MFFYLSFLRPPPVECAASSSSIPITPQIANDLRTELYQDDIDIMYTWLSPARAPTPARKLTTWREGNAYKPLEVPLPPGMRVGDELVLGLHVGGGGAVCSIENPDTVGRTPLPVRSAPIRVVKRPTGTGDKKQEIVERTFYLGDKVPPVRVREQTSFDLDKKMWDSGLGLSSWLVNLLRMDPSVGEDALVGRVRECLNNTECHILELGTGTGFVSLMLYALLASLPSSRARILATDLPSALPLIEHNIASVKLKSPSDSVSLDGAVLDWDEPSISSTAHTPDVVVMADVTYNTAAFPSLISTLERLAPPHVLMGYKERDPAERELWRLLEESQLRMKLVRVGEVGGAGGAPVEVWVGCRAVEDL
ncbi:hypothetical protein EXIGLDRAFT_638368 [Exidia glandulosa HHB12029]|uniref:S-adenosyl-L-methionine-dependent methyltransferase n=1 Tax=Exidia glandulosa HHB12029 TaxID=1314781 RepID=A0A165NWK0_EXIGL|nr:hypothetical protein EXIGLDRAFT_638368 [Exidia glandulosa HHB12029]